jgi:NADH:ubiquinone reductase (H+-translocating)
MEPSRSNPHRIIIVGGGAGGLELAVRLGRRLGRKRKAEVVLVDVARTHLWKPLLHQVAAGTLDTHSDELEYLALARANQFTFRLGRMEGVDRDRREIFLAATYDDEGKEVLPRRTLAYDTLVMAIGSQTNDFGTPGVHEHSIMLDTADAAERFHDKLLNTCMRAQAKSTAPGEGRFTVTIIGGGATGVELSAELHMTAKILAGYGLGNFNPERDLKIAIVEAGPRLLQVLPERLSSAVSRELENLDIEVHTGERVVEVTEEGVRMASGKYIPSAIVVWAAGVKVPDYVKQFGGLETNKINQFIVHKTMQTTLDPRIFAMGDCAAIPQGEGLPAVPPRAQSAHQEASVLARSLERMLEGKPLLEFKYRDRGSLVSIGDQSTVGSLMGSIARGSVFIEGTIARWMYWSLHKQHQVTVIGWFRTWLATWAEAIDWIRNPRIKLH